MKNHKYKYGEYAYMLATGEIVKIIGSTAEASLFGIINHLKVEKLSEIDPNTGIATGYYKCKGHHISPIKDEDVQFLLKMVNNTEIFNLARQL